LLKLADVGDRRKNLAEIARRYVFTEAGDTALEALAVAEFYAAQPLLSARLKEQDPPKVGVNKDTDHALHSDLAFARLLDLRGGPNALNQHLLFKAAVAFRSVGDRAQSERMWSALTEKARRDDYRVTKEMTLEELRDELDRRASWNMVGGDPSRAAQTEGKLPYLGKVWEQSMFIENTKGSVQKWIREAVQSLDDRRNAAIPAFTPITAIADVPRKGRVQLAIYRSHWGIHAVDVKTGLMLWDADCPRSLEKMYTEPRTQQAIENWKQQYQAIGLLHVVLENSVIGSLTSDGERIYVVDDLPVPPFLGGIFNAWPGKPQLPWGAEVNDATLHNVLHAYGAGDGKMRWKLGGTGAKKNTNDPKGEMNGCHYLGPPLPLGGRLYAIHAQDNALRLAVIQPATGKLDRIISLAKTGTPLLEDPFRRLHAAHPAYGDGILVCPTNAGAIVGVDLRSLSIAWAYRYREDKSVAGNGTQNNDDLFRDDSPERRINFLRANLRRFEEWKNTAPAVVDGKVIFTAPDSTFLYCLAAKDGSLLWKVDHHQNDLYLGGVYRGKVLVVGKERCRTLNLADGKETWSLETGMPSGRGIVADNRYYLPLKSAAESRKPEVCIIDMTNGKIVAHARPSKIEVERDIVPGNLLFFGDRLLSQSATHIIAYPELDAHLKWLDESLTANPRDPAALLERGQLLLDKGDLSKAVEDLRFALANTPAEPIRERARLVLFEALSVLLQKDFDTPQKDLKEYEELTQVDFLRTTNAAAEVQRRRGIYYTVIAQGYEQIGKPVEALRAYLDFAATAPPNQLLPAPDDPAVRVAPEVWARGHIQALFKRATPEQRKQLEEEIEKRLKK
jgi:hypothetical protein